MTSIAIPNFLATLGWNEFFANQCATLTDPNLTAARVVGEERGLFRIQYSAEGPMWAELKGSLRHNVQSKRDLPAVGDWACVAIKPSAKVATLHQVLARRTCLSRKAAGTNDLDEQILAANVDTAFIATSLNGDFNVRRLERYFSMAWNGGATPVVLLTKADLATDPEPLMAEIKGIAPDVAVIALSSHAGLGLDQLRPYLGPGQTAVIVGSSGVGKSTLVNRLVGKELLKTSHIRHSDDKGRHTTTTRNLVPLPSGGVLIDTPGIRELHLWEDTEGLARLFSDIDELAARCRFTDCQHRSEPGCAIRAALDNGTLSRERLQSRDDLARQMALQQQKLSKSSKVAGRAHHKRKK